MKHFKTSILASAMCLAASPLCQTASAQIHLTADLQNNHLWRGMEVADGCLILTDLSYTFGAGHATLGLWGGTNTQGNYKEFNHYVTLRGAGFENFYGETSGVVHTQLKVSYDLKIGSYTVPVHAMGMWNPQSEKAYFQIGAQLIHL